MDNVISIFTGEKPCDYLLMDESEFKKQFMQNWAGTHMWECQDCLKRWTNSNRYALADAIEKQYSTLEEQDGQ